MITRIGIGYDVHPLDYNLPFYLGGIKIEHYKGAVGHSDADVLIHSICDALLGAAGLGDIGLHFPDTSDEYKGIDSKILLKKTVRLVKQKGFSIGNIDSIVILEKPKIRKYISIMQQTLADVMEIYPQEISIKATTSEGMGFIGKERGVAAQAVALIFKD